MATFGDLQQLALALPATTGRLSYGTPAFFAGKILFTRLRDDLATIVLKMSFADRDAAMANEPEFFFITDHYLKYEMVCAHLERLTEERLAEELRKSWWIAATPKLRLLQRA